jgi:hypothetical protein
MALETLTFDFNANFSPLGTDFIAAFEDSSPDSLAGYTASELLSAAKKAVEDDDDQFEDDDEEDEDEDEDDEFEDDDEVDDDVDEDDDDEYEDDDEDEDDDDEDEDDDDVDELQVRRF